jgi:hypothetical protein
MKWCYSAFLAAQKIRHYSAEKYYALLTENLTIMMIL